MFQVFYSVLIQPLILLLRQVLSAAYDLTGSYGLSILLMSVIINILIAPFYGLADSWQKEEQLLQKKMKRTRDDIKAVFKGDEQFFYLRTLHRQNGYSPLMAVRSSFGLLIQIPFFIGAYQFLSHFSPLQGESFLFLKDLATPDHIAGMVNIMPFIMTALNLVSAYVFSGDQSKRGQYQLYGMAALFLVLLYNSPSGLLLYWSCNNLISLIKNLINRYGLVRLLKKIPTGSDTMYRVIRLPRLFLLLISAYTAASVGLYYLSKTTLSVLLVQLAYFPMIYLALLGSLFFLSRYKKGFFSHLVLLALFALWIQAGLNLVSGPFHMDLKDLILNLVEIAFFSVFLSLLEFFDSYLERRIKLEDRNFKKALILSIMIPVLLAGLVIPGSLVASSPSEMGISAALLFQVFFWALFCLALLPLFLLYVSPRSFRRPFLFILVSMTVAAVVNFLFFPGHYGVISESLQFEFAVVKESKSDILINLAILGFSSLCVLLAFLRGKLQRINQLLAIVMVALVGLAGINAVKLAGSEKKVTAGSGTQEALVRRIPFAREQPNTVILFVDRALAGAVPEALEAWPELSRLYDGFTWYPDTLSFGVNTITTLPAMLGGYEYTPQGMATRPEMTLKEKVKEGLMVLPEIFLERGSSVYVSIPLHKGFDLQQEDLETLQKEDVITEDLKSLYAGRWLKEKGIPGDFGQFLQRDKSLFLFSLFRMAPKYFRKDLYDKGSWHSLNKADPDFSEFNNLHNALSFLEEWAVLDYLPDLCTPDAVKPTFSIIGNKATHEPYGVDKNSHITSSVIEYPQRDIEKYGSVISAAHIYTDTAVLVKISEWFEWMKKEGLYDNTQIIVVGDHGLPGQNVKNRYFHNQTEKYPEYVGFHPLLLVKPFNTRGELKTSEDFMTNADVASLVLEAFGGGSNPFTGNLINGEAKKSPLLIGSGSNLIYKHTRDSYQYDRQYYVSDSMLDPSNWSVAE